MVVVFNRHVKAFKLLLMWCYGLLFVTDLKFIFIILSLCNCIEEEIKEKIATGNRAFHVHKKLFTSKLISRNIKLQYVGIKCQLDETEVFIADLIACSTCFGHHYAHYQELKSIIQWLLPVVFHAVVFKLLVWCGAEGYVSGLQDAGKPAIRSAIKTSVASSWHFISTY